MSYIFHTNVLIPVKFHIYFKGNFQSVIRKEKEKHAGGCTPTTSVY